MSSPSLPNRLLATRLVEGLPASPPFVGPEELARRSGHASLIRLGANESPFGPPPSALEAMRAELARISWYGDPESMELRRALALRHRCAPENICVGAGIDDLLGLAARAYLAGEAVVLTEGTYPTFMYHVAGYGGRAIFAPYAEDGRVPLETLVELAQRRRPRAVYLANPDNPSGFTATVAEIDRLMEALPPETMLILDEAYADFLDETYHDGAVHPRAIRFRTFSKAYGCAGARVGYTLAPPEVTAAFQKIRLHFNVNRAAQAGALAALAESAFVAEVKRETERGRREYAALGERLGCPTLPSSTNFVCFDLGTRSRAEAMVAELLRRGVFVRKPNAPPLDRCIRVSVGNAEERAHFAEILAASLETLAAA